MSAEEDILTQTTTDAAGDKECFCSPCAAHRSTSMIACANCSKPILLACLHHQFKQTGGSALKHACSLEWLQAFIGHSDLRYVCKSCQHQPRDSYSSMASNGNFNIGKSPSNLDMISIQQSITDLNNKIAHVLKKLQSINSQTLNVNQSIQPATDTTHSEMGTSYAEVTSTGIIKAVHDAVSSSLKVKSADDRAEVSVMVFGLPESKLDMDNVSQLLNDNIHSIVHIQRIGKLPNSSKNPRPLRVELACKEDGIWVLRNAKSLLKAYTIVHTFAFLNVLSLKISRKSKS